MEANSQSFAEECPFSHAAVDQLGGPECVAEMTGRKARVVRNAQGRGVYRMRAKPDSQEMDSLNVKETGMQQIHHRQPLSLDTAPKPHVSLLNDNPWMVNSPPVSWLAGCH